MRGLEHYRNSKRSLMRLLTSALVLVVLSCTVSVEAAKVINGSVPYQYQEGTASWNNPAQNSKTITPSDLVGRYKLNYTGNINFKTEWIVGTNNGEPGGYKYNAVYNDLGLSRYYNTSSYKAGQTQYYTQDRYGLGLISSFNSTQIQPNSSVATLTKSVGAAGVKKAYLIWYCRDSGKLFDYYNDPVYFKTPTGSTMWIPPQYACADTRYGTDTLICMYADVTEVVQQNGYGQYGVGNIPYYYQTNGTVAGATAGVSCGGWQLVVVEEGNDFNMRAVKIDIGSTFIDPETNKYSGGITLANGLKTKPAGDSSAQVMFSGLLSETQYPDGSPTYIKNNISSDTGGTLTGEYIYTNGMFNSGSKVSTHDGVIFGSLKEFANVGNNATKITFSGNSGSGLEWNTYFCMGMAVDIAFPDFAGEQQTTVNSDNSAVTVTGWNENITEDTNTGVGGGELTVSIDNELEVISNTLTMTYANGTTKQITGTYDSSSNTVTYNGVSLINKGDKFNYTIQCRIARSDDDLFENEHKLSGYLYSNGASITGYKIERTCGSSSKLDMMLKITLDSNGSAIDGGTVASQGTSYYYEYYNIGYYSDATHTRTISKIQVPTKDYCTFAGYYKDKNFTGSPCVLADGTINTTASEFTTDTTLYAKWEPKVFKITLDSLGAENKGTTEFYEKYGTGYYADVNCTTPIQNIQIPIKLGSTFNAYWEKKGGDITGNTVRVDTAGKISTLSNPFIYKQDTTLYADWGHVTFTITLDNQGANYAGSARIYEKYDEYFMYDAIIPIDGTQNIGYGYTGGVQTFTAPYTGTYFLQVYGAQGSSQYATGGLGGYSCGVVTLNQGETIYIYVGGAGSGATGGYNGGNIGASFVDWWQTAGGGGGTDIRRGGAAVGNRIIVAGGGGGSAHTAQGNQYWIQGGNAGGTGYQPFLVATTSGDMFSNLVWNNQTSAIWYYSPQLHTANGAGAGGGYYGGRNRQNTTAISAGEGGTGYIGGVTSGTVGGTQFNANCLAAQRSGHGYAIVTRANYKAVVAQTTKIDIPVKSGYYFLGYYTSSGEAVINSKGDIIVDPDYFKSDDTVYARWSTVRQPEYTIVYSGNNTTNNIYGDACTTTYTGITPSTQCVYNSNVTLADNGFSKVGYVFKQWNTKSDGTGVGYASGQKLATPNFVSTDGGSITLYAIWEPIVYTVQFNSNDDDLGNWNENDIVKYNNGICNVRFDQYITLPAVMFSRTAPIELSDGIRVNSGYSFIGWGTTGNETTPVYSDKATVRNVNNAKDNAQVVNLYALWKKDISLTVNTNGGSINGATSASKKTVTVYNHTYSTTFDMSSYYCSYDTNGIGSTNRKVDSNGVKYRYLGLNSNSSANKPQSKYDNYSSSHSTTYKAYDSQTLYAIWEPSLKMTAAMGRTLDNDVISGDADGVTPNSLSYISFMTSERADYAIKAYGNVTAAYVTFDSNFTEVYRLADTQERFSKYNDNLNDAYMASDNSLDLALYAGDIYEYSYGSSFYIPTYIMEYQAEKIPATNVNTFEVKLQAVNENSYYYNQYVGTKEIAEIRCYIKVGPDSGGNSEIHNQLKYHLRVSE